MKRKKTTFALIWSFLYSFNFFLYFQYETMEDWKITDISRSYIWHPSKDNETGFLVFQMYEMSESIYWLAPDLYCGNKLQSYGSNLVFTISWVSTVFFLFV